MRMNTMVFLYKATIGEPEDHIIKLIIDTKTDVSKPPRCNNNRVVNYEFGQGRREGSVQVL
jgi:hypothetical protein